MYMLMVGVCMLGTAVTRWQFQCTGWPREIRLLRGKENKWACHRRDVSCLLNMNAYSKYVALRQAFVFSRVWICYSAMSAHMHDRASFTSHCDLISDTEPEGLSKGFPGAVWTCLRFGKRGENASKGRPACLCEIMPRRSAALSAPV